ncbi:hypothetical protein ACQEU6_02030 [Spirillospora sp. CA-108201]
MAPSPCRTRGGKVAGKYHTARFILVPGLRDLFEVPAPAGRRPGAAWYAALCPSDRDSAGITPEATPPSSNSPAKDALQSDRSSWP